MKTSSYWRHYVQQGKTMDNTFYICENINIFGYMRARVNNQTGRILVHIYPLFNNNLHVKYRSNLIRTFWVKIKNMKKINFICFQGHVGPLHKIQGYQGHQNVSKCRPHHSGDICTIRVSNLKTSFSCKKRGLEGSSMIRLGLSCFPAILSPISMYMWNKEAIW